MVEIKKQIKARTLIGAQSVSLRVTIPQEIRKVIEVKAGDYLDWTLTQSSDKPIITIEVIPKEEVNNDDTIEKEE